MGARLLAVLAAVFLASGTALAGPFDDCAEHLPFGVPALAQTIHATAVCHPGYAALLDDDRHVPRWVAYHLTAAHTLGCVPRKNDFHTDEELPAGDQARAADYRRSGYDRGHQAPAEDFAWNAEEMHDSFSMANMAPQLPGLNRGEWERLEETVRAWALQRGELVIYVGPTLVDDNEMIGVDHVVVPSGFWKVIVDPVRREALAFSMPQRRIPKGDLAPWETSIQAMEDKAGISLPLPDRIDRSARPP